MKLTRTIISQIPIDLWKIILKKLSWGDYVSLCNSFYLSKEKLSQLSNWAKNHFPFYIEIKLLPPLSFMNGLVKTNIGINSQPIIIKLLANGSIPYQETDASVTYYWEKYAQSRTYKQKIYTDNDGIPRLHSKISNSDRAFIVFTSLVNYNQQKSGISIVYDVLSYSCRNNVAQKLNEPIIIQEWENGKFICDRRYTKSEILMPPTPIQKRILNFICKILCLPTL